MKIFTPDSKSAPSYSGRMSILFVLLAFVVLAAGYSVINPLHEATDELRHYRFVRTISTTGQLPIQGEERCRSQSHHPPLFYAIGALATFWIDTGRDLCETPPENPFWAYRYWEVGRDNKNQFLHGADESFPWQGEALAVHILRGINILIGAGVVWLTWASGRIIWPRSSVMAVGAASLVAFNPMFLYMSGAINNDVIAALSGAGILFACLYLIHDPEGLRYRWGFIFAALYSIALLSKANLAVTIILIEAAVTWVAWRKWQGRMWLAVNLIMLSIAGLVAGWWFVRNLTLYGDLTGFTRVTELWGVRNPADSFALAISELPYAWTTLWGRFGFGQIPLPDIIYQGLLILTVVGLVGAIIGFIRRATYFERVSLLLLSLDVILFFGVLFGYMLVSPAGPNGRFFFPALAALALLTFYGLIQWILVIQQAIAWASGRIRRVHPSPISDGLTTGIVSTMILLAMLTLAAVVLVKILAPAYARPPSLDDQVIIPNETNARFDSLATLLGYQVDTDRVVPGEPVDISLFWEVNAKPPGDYLLFVHLINEEGSIIAQRDTHPGLGNYPTGQWQEGDRFQDTIRVYLPETAYAPSEAAISIGLYDPLAYRLAVFTEDGLPLGDSLNIGEITIEEKAGQYPNPQDQNFNNEIKLVGYSYDELEVKPGETLSIDLYWQALRDVEADYIIQVRLVDNQGRIWGDADARPVQGTSPTNTWQAGQIRTDTHELFLDPEIEAGTYVIDIALYDADTGRRQNIVANDGHWIDSHLELAPIKVGS